MAWGCGQHPSSLLPSLPPPRHLWKWEKQIVVGHHTAPPRFAAVLIPARRSGRRLGSPAPTCGSRSPSRSGWRPPPLQGRLSPTAQASRGCPSGSAGPGCREQSPGEGLWEQCRADTWDISLPGHCSVSMWPLLPAPPLCPHVPRGHCTCVVYARTASLDGGRPVVPEPLGGPGLPSGTYLLAGRRGVDRWENRGPKSGITVAARGSPPRVPSCSSLFSASWPTMGVFMAGSRPGTAWR